MDESAAFAVRAGSRRPTSSEPSAVHLVTLGCARNDVDSEELAAQLDSSGFRLVADPLEADAVLSIPAVSSRQPRRTRSTQCSQLLI